MQSEGPKWKEFCSTAFCAEKCLLWCSNCAVSQVFCCKQRGARGSNIFRTTVSFMVPISLALRSSNLSSLCVSHLKLEFQNDLRRILRSLGLHWSSSPLSHSTGSSPSTPHRLDFTVFSPGQRYDCADEVQRKTEAVHFDASDAAVSASCCSGVSILFGCKILKQVALTF